MRGRWLTPSELPGTTRCWAISIPDSVDFFALLKGAIDDLRFSSNFEEFGALSPDDTASAFAIAFDTIAECIGSSRMTGEIIAYATTNPPSGTLACDGSTHLRVDYPDLYAVLAAAFISDADHFVTPDLRGRSIVGIGQGVGLTDRTMNDDGGEETIVLTEAQLATHAHTLYTPTLAPIAMVGTGGFAASGIALTATNSTGSSQAHENMHPFLSLGYAIVT